ncbi:uncharacterized protein LOC27207940 [Drosophila simulans]|uniref:Uncharacterized protein n=1 Tax=Drosophila simulans TaxID=7240 RepID=A0A0J9QXD8_DROSI|nr:uncharacterized protein LOC27207940 [Drosophila simulans]KMY88389.1 uncharacterized protein Dsimw501_GD28091 [Drosophila simulans]
MNAYHKCILLFLCATFSVHLVNSLDKLDINAILTKFKNLAVQTAGIHLQNIKSDINITSKEFCMKSDERTNRFKRIIFLQKEVILKLQSQLLEQTLNCSNLRQRVRRLIDSYTKLKFEVEKLKSKSGTTDGPKNESLYKSQIVDLLD